MKLAVTLFALLLVGAPALAAAPRERRLDRRNPSALAAAAAPDGRVLLVRSRHGGVIAQVLSGRTLGAATRLGPSASRGLAAVWEPGSQTWVVAAAATSRPLSLWRLPAAGGPATAVAAPASEAEGYPSLASDGDLLVAFRRPGGIDAVARYGPGAAGARGPAVDVSGSGAGAPSLAADASTHEALVTWLAADGIAARVLDPGGSPAGDVRRLEPLPTTTDGDAPRHRFGDPAAAARPEGGWEVVHQAYVASVDPTPPCGDICPAEEVWRLEALGVDAAGTPGLPVAGPRGAPDADGPVALAWPTVVWGTATGGPWTYAVRSGRLVRSAPLGSWLASDPVAAAATAGGVAYLYDEEGTRLALPSPAGPPDRRAPTVSVRSARYARGRLTVRLRCDERCRLARLQVSRSGGGAVPFSLSATTVAIRTARPRGAERFRIVGRVRDARGNADSFAVSA